ncbi:hypothetical protein TSUD_392710 [Trifolium subterraneum]|uniref:DUF4408 domain-containing protein n=1 Tax=Trifolium subterraneum TaxID=3900 RepID=A0A2Z6MFB7_TRISU|nr:hypothetical protein TSUD_392710 [Trifolium subterraneum]
MDEAGSVSISAYDVMTSWFTPSCIFLFVNLVIGTIAITTRFAAQRKGDSPPQLVRSTSFFGRVTSFGHGCCKYKPIIAAATTTTPEETHIEPVDNCDVPQLDRAISSTMLDRVKSIDLGLSKTEINKGSDDLTKNPLPRAPSLLERLMSRNFRRLDSVKEEKKPESEVELESNREILRGRAEEEEVDAKADDFIKRFKQQLRMERLDSILRYRDILNRH